MSGMSALNSVELDMYPVQGQDSLIESVKREAAERGYSGGSWPDVSYQRVLNKGGPGNYGKVEETVVTYLDSSVSIVKIRSGVCRNHYEVNGQYFNHWGGPCGAEGYAKWAAVLKHHAPSAPVSKLLDHLLEVFQRVAGGRWCSGISTANPRRRPGLQIEKNDQGAIVSFQLLPPAAEMTVDALIDRASAARKARGR